LDSVATMDTFRRLMLRIFRKRSSSGRHDSTLPRGSDGDEQTVESAAPANPENWQEIFKILRELELLAGDEDSVDVIKLYGQCFHDYLRNVNDLTELRKVLVSSPRAAVNDAKRLRNSCAATDTPSTIGETLRGNRDYNYSFCLGRLVMKNDVRHCPACSQCVETYRVHCDVCDQCSYGLGTLASRKRCEFCVTEVAATPSSALSVANVSDLSWSDAGVLDRTSSKSFGSWRAAADRISYSSYSSKTSYERRWSSSTDSGSHILLCSSTPALVNARNSSFFLDDFWMMNTKRSIDDILTQDCCGQYFYSMKTANSADF